MKKYYNRTLKIDFILPLLACIKIQKQFQQKRKSKTYPSFVYTFIHSFILTIIDDCIPPPNANKKPKQRNQKSKDSHIREAMKNLKQKQNHKKKQNLKHYQCCHQGCDDNFLGWSFSMFI